MIHIKRDCIALEGGICKGPDCRNRLFCSHSVFTYWREAWLERPGIVQEGAQEGEWEKMAS